MARLRNAVVSGFFVAAGPFAFCLASRAEPRPVRPNPVFLSPQSSVATGRTLLVVGQGELRFDSRDLTEVSLDASADSGRTWQPIRAVVGLDGEQSELWQAYWDTASIPSGFYLIRATMTYRQDGQLRRRFRCRGMVVNRPPVVRSVHVVPDFEPGYVRFDGSDVIDPDGEVKYWRWDFGDPTANQEARFSRGGREAITYFAEPDRCYSVRLLIADEHDATTEAVYRLCPGESGVLISVDRTCTCKSLKVRTRGQALGPDANGSAWPEMAKLFDGKTLGPLRENPKNTSKRVGFSFEVVAEVEGNASLCPETQLIKRTFGELHPGIEDHKIYTGKADRNLDGISEMDSSDEPGCTTAGGTWARATADKPGRCEFPQSGDGYAPDSMSDGLLLGSDYDRPVTDGYKQHVGTKILWFDTPGFSGDLALGASYKADFIAMLRSSPPSNLYCYAKFQVDLERKNGGNKEELTSSFEINSDGDVIGRVDQESVEGVP